jgi:Trypsin-like peptidase domain
MAARNRFAAVIRAVIIILSILALGLIIVSFFPQPVIQSLSWLFNARPIVTPAPPTILIPRGRMPIGVVGLQQWTQEPGHGFTVSGTSGFVLRLSGGGIVGVTTAHSLFEGNPHRILQRVGLAVNGQNTPIVESDTYFGLPGVPFSDSSDLTVDFVLLKLDTTTIDPALVLTPDPRGSPQTGERVTLFSGLGDGKGGALLWAGTVLSAEPKMALILMDEAALYPGGMSGSPVLSQYTGDVVGMEVGAGLQGRRWLLGIHPVGHLVQVAETADEFPLMMDYRR